ncbi:hypothetical protein [Vibrio sp. 10N.239.312.D08]|uniref:hypothetical protein n=1 Tax=Vibrio sp. 10N.239.312.D08 TaxID=3229978 RepID=UPI003553D65F
MNTDNFSETSDYFSDSLKEAFMHDDSHFADLLRKKLKLWFSKIDSPVASWAIEILDEKTNHELVKDELACISDCITKIVDSLNLSSKEFKEAEELESLVVRQVRAI